jgi:hypothetical protein
MKTRVQATMPFLREDRPVEGGDLTAPPRVALCDLEGRLPLKSFYLLVATADRLKDPVRDV